MQNFESRQKHGRFVAILSLDKTVENDAIIEDVPHLAENVASYKTEGETLFQTALENGASNNKLKVFLNKNKHNPLFWIVVGILIVGILAASGYFTLKAMDAAGKHNAAVARQLEWSNMGRGEDYLLWDPEPKIFVGYGLSEEKFTALVEKVKEISSEKNNCFIQRISDDDLQNAKDKIINYKTGSEQGKSLGTDMYLFSDYPKSVTQTPVAEKVDEIKEAMDGCPLLQKGASALYVYKKIPSIFEEDVAKKNKQPLVPYKKIAILKITTDADGAITAIEDAGGFGVVEIGYEKLAKTSKKMN